MSKSQNEEALAYMRRNGDGEICIRVDISGADAMFADPFISEHISYDCITPAAINGILKCIYWHPGCEYVTDRIVVLNRIRKEGLAFNGVGEKLSWSEAEKLSKSGKKTYASPVKLVTQITNLRLRDVHYVVDVHVRMTKEAAEQDSCEKYAHQLVRRLIQGQYYKAPFLGTRECECNLSVLNPDAPIAKSENVGNKNLGTMFYDWKEYGKTGIFFEVEMTDGIIDVRNAKKFVPYTEVLQ